jgi:tetratricopeptide (TPR) repeat protein
MLLFRVIARALLSAVYVMLTGFLFYSHAQTSAVPALEAELRSIRTDTGKIRILSALSSAEAGENKKELALRHADQALTIAGKPSNRTRLAMAMCAKGGALIKYGKFGESRKLLREALAVAGVYRDEEQKAHINNCMGFAWYAQNVGDSAIVCHKAALENIEKMTAGDSVRLKMATSAYVCESYVMVRKQAAAAPYFEELRRLAAKIGDLTNEAWALAQLSVIYQVEGDFRRSIYYGDLELEVGKKAGIPVIEGDAHSHIAVCYNALGDLPKSVEHFTKVIEIYRKVGEVSGMASAQSNLAEVYFKHKEVGKALELYQSSLKSAIELKDDYIRAATLHNIGEIYLNQHQDEKAMNYFREALAVNVATGQTPFIVQNHIGIGNVFLNATRYDSAMHHFTMADRLAKENQLTSEIASVAGHIGKLYLVKALDSQAVGKEDRKMANLSKAIDYFNTAVRIFQELGMVSQLEDNYRDLSEVYKAKGDYKTSMEFYQKANTIKDSIFNQQNAFKIARLESDAVIAQKNEEISHTKEETSRVRRQSTYWYLAGASVLLLGVLSFFIYRLQSRRKATLMKTEFDKQVAEMEMQALRAQMNPHFIFNCLNSINRYIVKSDSVTASGYLTKFSKLIRLILDHSASGNITLSSEKQMLLLYLEMESLRFSNKFTYEVVLDPGLDPESVLIPAMLIQPYIENAIWHGLLHKEEAGHVSVRFSDGGNSMLRVVVEDDGIGREQAALLKSRNALKEKSHGMRITGDRLRLVNERQGTEASLLVIDIKSPSGEASGTRIVLNIPYGSGDTD